MKFQMNMSDKTEFYLTYIIYDTTIRNQSQFITKSEKES